MDDFTNYLDIVYRCISGIIIDVVDNLDSSSNLKAPEITFKAFYGIEDVVSVLGLVNGVDVKVEAGVYVLNVDSVTVVGDTILLVKGMKAVSCKVSMQESSVDIGVRETLVKVFVRE